MIIHCLSCGKSVSDKLHKCPYCIAEINQFTLEMNGIAEKACFKERVREMVFSFVHR
ncbi:hypothetical protein GF354_01295 [Candidatus Peregrinibacteria bacterium]|nr:hypothetical protein [Candidatus Peregrinibacteria bacterium]